MSRLADLEKQAIDRLKMFEPDDGYWLGYSGGKDSDCIKILAALSGVKYEAHHSLTTVDAPKTVRYIKSQTDIIIDRPKKTMWQLIPEYGVPPTRIMRYCCGELKEQGGKGRVKILGVRWAESAKRAESAGVVRIIGKPKTVQKIADKTGVDYRITKQQGLVMNDDNDENRRVVEQCYRTTSTMVNPIVDWTDTDVWEFLRAYGCNSNPLYGCKMKRIGCVGCPVSGKERYSEFVRYPKYKENYIKAFARMKKENEKRGRIFGKNQTAEEIFAWWMREDINQTSLFDFEEND